MTFIPSILTNVDSNNSAVITTNTFTGTYTNVVGYNMLILTINSTSDLQIEIYFSDNGVDVLDTFKDTYFGTTGTTYTKNFQLSKSYYKISILTSATFTVSSRLSTTLITNSLSYDENIRKNTNDFALDAFGKLRVTNPTTLLDIKFPGQSDGTYEFRSNYELLCAATGPNTIAAGATGIYQNGYCLITATGSNQRYISQSRKYCIYQPGKSQLFLGSGIINAYTGGNTGTDTSSKIGYFDDNNGFYFEYTNDLIYVCIRNNSVNNPRVVQTSWNIDKMDGYGPSGIVLDFTKCQLFVIDFEWLAVGKIRFGFYANGIINYCHEITNINSLTSPYMLTSNLPVRYELQTGNEVSSQASLMQICSSVISEGGYNPIGRTFSASSGTTTYPVTTETAIIAIKAISTYKHQNIVPTDLDIFNITANTNINYKIRLFLSPTVDPGTFSWNSVNSNSIVSYALNPTGITYTNSIIITEGYTTNRSNTNLNLNNFFNNIFQLTSDINNNSDIIVITATTVGSAGTNPSVCASLTWQEVY